MIVAPILIHLAITYGLSLYSGTAFNADIKSGLSDTVDHLLSHAMPQRSTIAPPITAVIETKSRKRGISHCLVQMVAAQGVNACLDPVYGVVTNGLLWQFLKYGHDQPESIPPLFKSAATLLACPSGSG